jgi:SpoVK/Ycf46/Vps4 family AAA+-type ATPase
MEDIVKGKTGGVVILATGYPGTGKTLTAEIYAESLQKPLYVVQCSQLGTDEESIENKLKRVLGRASRWGAVLLIDEADVYIRERSSDIQQNAIVGVFLRLLERYRGVLFLTSNRATIIDDAIISRVSAHIKYELPNKEDLASIWKVLSEQYKVDMDKKLISEIVAKLPVVSGRDVKNMLRLVNMMLVKQGNNKPSLETILNASKYLDLSSANDKPMAS